MISEPHVACAHSFTWPAHPLIWRAWPACRALTPPGYIKDWHVGVRQTSNNKLLGFITGIPVHIRVYDKSVPLLRPTLTPVCLARIPAFRLPGIVLVPFRSHICAEARVRCVFPLSLHSRSN
jgi:hypothetical protein